MPWWPPVIARTMSNSFSVAMKTVTATTTMAERIDGTVILQKIWLGLAPSMRAASTISSGDALERGGEDHRGEADLDPDEHDHEQEVVDRVSC